jgi:hypothetical protein
MRLNLRVAALAAIVCLALPAGFAHAASTAKSGHGTLVIVFKDGHRQSYNLSDIERVEFPASAASSTAGESTPGNSSSPSRAHYLGKWEVGDGNGRSFFITLYDDGAARKTLGSTRGRWAYVDGEAQITWDDGWQDAIRKSGAGFQKFAYGSGKTFHDSADNVTSAHNTTPHPI